MVLAAGVPASALTLHGNNKSMDELRMAIDAGVGRVVVDFPDEVARLESVTGSHRAKQRVLLRVNPGVAATTHQSMQTGHATSKFGFNLGNGQAAAFVDRVRTSPGLIFEGIHVHAGSQILALAPIIRAIGVAAAFARERDAAELIVGGGLGVASHLGEEAASLSAWGVAAHEAARTSGFRGSLLAEPGRAIVARAAITVYTIGTVKSVSDHLILLAVDGGISDNPRPGLYGSTYQPLLVRHPFVGTTNLMGPYTVVGKNCESSDTFARNVAFSAQPRVDDLLFLPVSGAYSYAMSSNYNGLPRPAVVLVRDARADLILRRECFDDLIRDDVFASHQS